MVKQITAIGKLSLSLSLVLALCVPNAAFAAPGIFGYRAESLDAYNISVASYSVGDRVVVEGSDLYFTVNDAEEKKVTVGGNTAHGALLTATGMDSVDKCAGLISIPADHKVVVPATITDADGATWTVSEIGTGAFMAVDKDNYINDVKIEATLDKVGDFAFSGLGSSFWTPSFRFEMAEGASVKEIAASAFNFVHADEIDFPEGSTIALTTDKNYGTANNRYCWTHTNIIGAKRIMLPLSYSGTVYQASCTQWLTQVGGTQNLASIGIPSPYASFVCDGLATETGTFTKAPTSFDVSSKHPTSVKVLLWKGSPAEQSFSSNSYLSKAEYYTVNHFAVLSDGVTLGVEVPDGQSAYVVPSTNVKLNNVTDGVISGTTEIPDGMLSVVDGDATEWTLAEGIDYTVNYYDSESATEALASAPATAGDYWVEFVGNNKTAWGKTGRYKLTLSQSKIALENDDVTLAIPEGGYTYDGTAHEPSVAVSHSGINLKADTDYTVAYFDNTDAGTATVTVTGVGAYAGSVSKSFGIAKVDLSHGTANITGGATYCGQEWKPNPTVKVGSLTVPRADYDAAYSNNVEPGIATVNVAAKEDSTNYTGNISTTFEIDAISMSSNVTTEARIKLDSSTGRYNLHALNNQTFGSSFYTGANPSPDLSLLVGAITYTPSGKLVTIPLTSNDYTAGEWVGGTDVGEKSITLTGKGHFSGNLILNWAIEAKSLAGDDVTVTGLDDQAWTGSAVTPPEPVVKVGDRTLVKGTDYEVTYGENLTDVGTVDVTITGKGNYTGSPKEAKFFRIGKLLTSAEVTIADADKQVYTGSPLTPVVTVKLGEDTLTEEQDYTVSWSDNVNAGTATVTITGADDYVGAVTKTFEIAKVEVAAPSAVSGLTYNGREQTGVVVADNAGYTVTGAAATNAGSYTATLTADGNHTFAGGKATAEVAWSIARAQVAKPTAKTGLKYTGKAQTGVTFATGAGYAMEGDTQATNAGSYTAKAKLDANHAWTGGSTGDATVSWSIAKAASSISLAAQSKTYTGKTLAYSGKVTKSGSTGAVTYAYYSDSACKKAVKAANVKAAGTYYVKATVAANANYAAATSAAAKFTVAKAANPLAVKAASKTLKAKTLKKKAQSFTPSVVKTKGQGTLSYVKGKVSKKSGNFTVNKKTGKITVKKGTPKGTYTVQVKVTAAGNANYKASAVKVAKVTVKVK